METIGFALLKGKQVNIYDSSFVNLDQASYKALQLQFRCSMCNIQLVNGVQKQTGVSDCGLFAVAYATTLVFKENPSQAKCNQKINEQTCHNLFHYKENGNIFMHIINFIQRQP